MVARRWFLQLVPAAGAALALPAPAAAQAYPRLDEKDPHAQLVGYVEDAARVDRLKYRKYAPGQDCFSCDLYKAKQTDAWGPCTLFPRRVVAGKGWCDAFRSRSTGR